VNLGAENPRISIRILLPKVFWLTASPQWWTSPLSVETTHESPRLDKPLSPHAEETVVESPKPPSPRSAKKPLGDGGAPSSLTYASPDQDPEVTPLRKETIESPKVTSRSPHAYGLRTAGGHQPGER
jgi:hypothetical protein